MHSPGVRATRLLTTSAPPPPPQGGGAAAVAGAVAATAFVAGGVAWWVLQGRSSVEKAEERFEHHQPLHHHHSTTTPPHFERLSLKQVLDRFTTNRKSLERDTAVPLGQGSFGHVLECVEPHTGREVAVKVVSKSMTRRVDFEREVEALRAARMCRHIVRILDVVDCDEAGIWLLVMERLAGGELFERILKQGPFEEVQARNVFEQVVDAVAFMHEAGWVHNDVKPENILFVAPPGTTNTDAPPSSGQEPLKLVDFGSARRVNELPGVAGTAAYWPPPVSSLAHEEAQVDPRTRDMWTLGILLYVLLFACHPFDRHGHATDEEIAERAKLGSRPGGYLTFAFEKYGVRASPEAMHVITRLLDPDPSTRMTLLELMDHPFWEVTTQHPPPSAEQEAKSVELKAALRSADRERRKNLLKALTLLAQQNEKSCYSSSSSPPTAASALSAFVQDVAALSSQYARRVASCGELFFPGGSPTDGMYVLVRGGVSVEYGDTSKIAQTLGPGDVFGETAVLDGRSTRNASVRCIADSCEAIFYPRDDVVSVLTVAPELRQRLEEVSNRRYRVRAGRILEKMIPGLETRKRHYEKGDSLWTKGEDARAIYLIKSGKVHSVLPVEDRHRVSPKDSWFVRVFMRGGAPEGEDGPAPYHDHNHATNATVSEGDPAAAVVVAEWAPGDLIGISALVGSTRMASAFVVSDEGADVVEISKEELRRCLDSEPSLRENLARHFRRFKERALASSSAAR